jgi:hypothetical protein
LRRRQDSPDISPGTPYFGTGFTAVSDQARDLAEAADAEPETSRMVANATAVIATALRLRAVPTIRTVIPIQRGWQLREHEIATKRYGQ